ncbi:hypothetical protein MBANPS3_007549, partial [Mucor bainieri]
LSIHSIAIMPKAAAAATTTTTTTETTETTTTKTKTVRKRQPNIDGVSQIKRTRNVKKPWHGNGVLSRVYDDRYLPKGYCYCRFDMQNPNHMLPPFPPPPKGRRCRCIAYNKDLKAKLDSSKPKELEVDTDIINRIANVGKGRRF